MKKDNRFSVLRRNNRNIFCKADITTEELAEKLGISTGTISKLENECQEGQVPNTTATVLKAYHDKLECSYEYLMGETKQEKISENMVNATKMPFKMLTTQDIENLTCIFSDPQYGSMYASFVSALLSKPDELKDLFHSLISSFKEIADTNKENDYPKRSKEIANRAVRYTYTTIFAERMEQYFIPCMDNVFKEYNDILFQEHKALEKDLNTLDLSTGERQNHLNTIVIDGSTISNLKIVKVEPEDSQ